MEEMVLGATNVRIRTTGDLLRELRNTGRATGTYSELEDALVGIMHANQDVLPSRLTARDVLVYARDNGLIARHGDKLTLAENLP